MNDFSLLDFFMASVSFSLAVLGLVIAVIMPLIDRWSRRFFIILFIDLVLCMTLFIVNAIICLEPVTVNTQLILWFFESLFLSIPIPMFTIYLLHCCGENMKGSTLLRSEISLWIVYFILLVFSQFTTNFFYITPDEQFETAPWYSLLIVPPFVGMVLNLAGVIRRWNSLSRYNQCAFFFFLLPFTTALFIHVVVVNFQILTIGITISVLSLFFVILANQSEEYMRQLQENVRLQASILQLQMRHHNPLTRTRLTRIRICHPSPRERSPTDCSYPM